LYDDTRKFSCLIVADSNPAFFTSIVDTVPAEWVDDFDQSHYTISLQTNLFRQFGDETDDRVVGILARRTVQRQSHEEMIVHDSNTSVTPLLNLSG
jgi:hypothetical protein